MSYRVHVGDCRAVLRTLNAGSVHCVVTSPPYYGLRSYLPDGDERKGDEIGLEQTPDEYVAALVEVFRDVRRVLRDDGCCWLNLGDSYASGDRGSYDADDKLAARGGQQRAPQPDGLKALDMLGIPWRVAFALQADGWYLRSDVVWAKQNCMPESLSGWHWTRHRVKMDANGRREEMLKVRRNQAADRLFDTAENGQTGQPLQDLQGGVYVGVSQDRSRQGVGPSVQGFAEGEGGARAVQENRGAQASAGSIQRERQRGCDPQSAVSPTPERPDVHGKEEGGESSALCDSERQGTGGGVSTDADVSGVAAAGAEGVCGEPCGTRGASGQAGSSPGGEGGGQRDAHTRGVAGDRQPAQGALLLLQDQGGAPDDGSRHPTGKGRTARQGEHRPGVPPVQFKEGREAGPAGVADADGWIVCPGCPKCTPHGGYVLRCGSWRPTKAHEFVFLLAKSAEYFCDGEGVREAPAREYGAPVTRERNVGGRTDGFSTPRGSDGAGCPEAGRNARSVWTLSSSPSAWDFCAACSRFYEGERRPVRADGVKRCACGATDRWVDHLALMPPALAEKCIRAGSPEKACGKCGAPWVRVVDRQPSDMAARYARGEPTRHGLLGAVGAGASNVGGYSGRIAVLGFRPSCPCAAEPVPATVLDPFSGGGTTGVKAVELGRRYIGIELRPEYARLSEERIRRAGREQLTFAEASA